MYRLISLLVAALLALPAFADTPTPPPDALATALADPARSAADRERDARDKPAAVLALANFSAGQVVADIFGGGGYYSEIIARVVGPEGKVRLINNAPYDNYAKADSSVRFAGSRLPNVSYEVAPPAAMKLGEATLDAALIVLSYHDLYYADTEQGWAAIDAGQFIDQIVTALKPDGVLLIVDHAAREGSGKADAQTLHRIDEAFAKADFLAHGLRWVASSDVLRRSEDDRSKNVFDPAIRGKTDRFVHVYRKPR